jgi:hypothetical protein
MPFKRTAIVTLIIVACIAILTKCMNNPDNKSLVESTPDFTRFAGPEKCAGCHKDVYEKHLQTAHHLSSQAATEKTIRGSFEKGRNRYQYNPLLHIDMEKRDSGLFQVVYYKGQERKVLPFDIAIGSGTKGQSFAYWLNNRLFQLPMTYYAIAEQWSNSPGFPSKVQFDRPITSRCMECHSSFASTIPGKEPEEFKKQELILGVGCEKCHGPGAEHVTFQTKNPTEKKAKFILNPASFSRQQKLDMCAVCHGGNIKKTQPSFSFTAGDKLSDYFESDTLNTAAINFGTVDVHGNQYGLLRASKCFRVSETLTCNTCHNTHENERGKLAVFSERCMSCHNTERNNFCTVKNIPTAALNENCINCHMPVGQSKSIVVFTEGSETPKAALFRSHFISVYPEETKKFLQQMKK